MNNNEFAIESFISFCDDMIITQESVFTTIKNGLVKLFTNIINFLERQVRKMKDGKAKQTLLRLLGKAKDGLTRSKNIREGDEEEVEELKQDAEEIQKEAKKLERVEGEIVSDEELEEIRERNRRTTNEDIVQ